VGFVNYCYGKIARCRTNGRKRKANMREAGRTGCCGDPNTTFYHITYILEAL